MHVHMQQVGLLIVLIGVVQIGMAIVLNVYGDVNLEARLTT